MRCYLLLVAVGAFLLPHATACAGLYLSAEPPVPLDDNLGTFLQQLGPLRSYGPPDGVTIPMETKGRKDYLGKVEQLRNKGRLTAQEQADLGAYLIRLKKTKTNAPFISEAVQALEAASREHPRDFRVLANLGTAYQLTGQLDVAERFLQQALDLAPPELQRVERYHLLLVRYRSRKQFAAGLSPLDRLFDVSFAADLWQAGSLAEGEKKKLPADAIKIVQQLLVWLPDDGALHWLFGELANAQGDVRAAHGALGQAVTFGLSTPELLRRRRELETAVAKLPRPTSDYALAAEESPPAPNDVIASLGARGWTVIALCGVLTLGLLALQVRQLYRRRSART